MGGGRHRAVSLATRRLVGRSACRAARLASCFLGPEGDTPSVRYGYAPIPSRMACLAGLGAGTHTRRHWREGGNRVISNGNRHIGAHVILPGFSTSAHLPSACLLARVYAPPELCQRGRRGRETYHGIPEPNPYGGVEMRSVYARVRPCGELRPGKKIVVARILA